MSQYEKYTTEKLTNILQDFKNYLKTNGKSLYGREIINVKIHMSSIEIILKKRSESIKNLQGDKI